MYLSNLEIESDCQTKKQGLADSENDVTHVITLALEHYIKSILSNLSTGSPSYRSFNESAVSFLRRYMNI